MVLVFAATLRDALNRLLQSHKDREKIIFLERFIHWQLLALLLAIFLLPKKNIYLLIFYRVNFHEHRTKSVYWLLTKLLKKTVYDRFALLCDNDTLAEGLAKFFGESIHIMPVNHPEFYRLKKWRESPQQIVCWWAGSPREEKGWGVIRKLVENPPPLAKKFCLVAARSANLKTPENGVQLILTEDKLSREEYIAWLEKTDVMLIPYDTKAYAQHPESSQKQYWRGSHHCWNLDGQRTVKIWSRRVDCPLG